MLPGDRNKLEKRKYYLRLIALTLVFASFLIIVAAVLRIPLLILEQGQARTSKGQADALSVKLASMGVNDSDSRLKVLSDNLTYLFRLSSTTSVTTTITTFTELPHPGISITGVNYTAGDKKALGKVTISGTAVSREALQKYVAALENTPLVRNTDLPISTYAKESDIPFVITVNGAF